MNFAQAIEYLRALMIALDDKYSLGQLLASFFSKLAYEALSWEEI